MADTSYPKDRPTGAAHVVMPANAGIHGFFRYDKNKPWMPAFAGINEAASPD